MKPINTQVPADTRACLQYWPATNALSIDTSVQTQYECIIDDELIPEGDFAKLNLLENDSIGDPIYKLVQDVFTCDEIQNLQLMARPDVSISNTRTAESVLGSRILELAQNHSAISHTSVADAGNRALSIDDAYAKLFSYIQKAACSEPAQSEATACSKYFILNMDLASICLPNPQPGKKDISQVALNGGASIGDNIDASDTLVSINSKRLSEFADNTEPNNVKCIRLESNNTDSEPIKQTTTSDQQMGLDVLLESNPRNDTYVPNPITGTSHCVIVDAKTTEDTTPLHIDLLDDFLQNVFREDDALSESSSASTLLFRKIEQLHGETAVISKRSIRRLRILISHCTQEQITKYISDDKMGRLVGLLVFAVEAAEEIGLIDMIRDGSLLERGIEISAEYCNKLDSCMSVSCLGLEAAAFILVLSATAKASNSACSGDSLHTAIAFFKGCLLNCVVPLLDLEPSCELACAIKDKSTSLHGRVQSLMAATLATNASAITLVSRSVLAEQDVISLVFASISTLFCSSEILGHGIDANLFESIRRSAQSLIGRVFELNSDQHAWILEEILASLIKLPSRKRTHSTYRLASGKPIQFITILLLRMLQGTAQSPEDLTAGFEGNDLSTKEYRMLLDKHQKAIDAASSSADFTIRYLISRCTKRDNKGATNEVEYRALLEGFIDDCIALLGHPQWPAAELVVRIYSLHILELLDEEKSDISLKTMALESAAQIASHIAHAQRDLETISVPGKPPVFVPLTVSSSLDDIKHFHKSTVALIGYLQTKAGDGESAGAISLYVSNWASILITVLLKSKRLRQAQSANSDASQKEAAQENTFLVEAKQGDCSNISSDSAEENDDDDDDASTSDEESDCASEHNGQASGPEHDKKTEGQALNVKRFHIEKRKAIESCLKDYMDIAHRSAKAITDNVSLVDAIEAAKAVFSLFPLYRSFDMLLTRVTMALGASQVTLRSKALRALNQIALHRPSVLYQANVKYAINHRLQDSSPQVREAAIDLIGRHIAQNPELTSQYYEFVSIRILDKGSSVRRRVMRILRDIYTLSQDQDQLVDVGMRILQRTSDDERTIRELAMKILQELWFTYDGYATAFGEDGPPTQMASNLFNLLSPEMQQQILKRVRVMTGVIEAAKSRELTELLTGLFDHVTNKATNAEAGEALFVIRCVIDALFEQLLQAEEIVVPSTKVQESINGIATAAAGSSLVSTAKCLRFISTLSVIAPDAVGLHAETLEAYLKMTDASEEETLHHVLTIFNNTLLKIPHPSARFLGSLESDLIALLSSSPQTILSIAVPCLCTLVEKITWNYAKIIRLFRSCVLQLYREQRLLAGGKPSTLSPKNLMRFIILAGLVCRHFDFDKHREKQKEHFKELDRLISGTVPEFMNDIFLFYASQPLPVSVQLAAIQMLGHLYIKRPQLALESRARAVMDNAYSGGSASHCLQVTRNFLEFLRADAQKYALQQTESKDKEREVDAKALVGNIGGMGDAGVGASLMQTYLDRIIDVAFAADSAPLRIAGFEVITLVLEQGLAHPLKCVPSLIALSTSSDPFIRTRALKLHQDLNFKYASFIHSRDIEGVYKAYEYQVQVRGRPEDVVGYDASADTKDMPERPVAYLQPLYSMLRSKRTRRNEFLTLLVKTGDYDSNSSYSEQHRADIPFVRFVAENIAALDYKYLDEVLHVIFQISAVIASTGLNLYHQFEADSRADSHDVEGGGGKEERSSKVQKHWKPATRASVCVWILHQLREFLKMHYNITEARCMAYNPGDTSARDKAASWHATGIKDMCIDWSACPYAFQRMESDFDFRNQRANFQQMMAGSLAMLDEHNSISSNDKHIPTDAQDQDISGFLSDDAVMQMEPEELEQLAMEDFDM
ncbi:sister chromatid cohesion C-terminus-domain-containing protein [Coemansia spiralis]|nr:sister chromatid cohesion C-terminus-domain-containing protein [Coemansia spiralis]